MLWLDFLNTDYHDWRGAGEDEDQLERPELVQRLLDAWGLEAPVPLPPEEVEELRGLRSWMRQMTERLVRGEALGTEQLARLNGYLEAAPVTLRIGLAPEGGQGTEGHYRLDEAVSDKAGWAAARGAIAVSFAKTLAQNEPGRIRVCVNPDCLWVFYDSTRSKTKRFCDDSMCGNLMKVRRFRAKRKGDAPGE